MKKGRRRKRNARSARRERQPGPLADWWSSRKPVFRFALVFGGLLVLFWAVLLTPAADRILLEYLRANAWLSAGILRLQGEPVLLEGLTIRSARFAMAVRRGCDAIEPAWLFTAAVLAFPAPWRRKACGIALGVPVLLLFNLLRVTSLYWAGVKAPALFFTIHLEIWPAAFILAVLLLWFLWMRWTRACELPDLV